MRKFTRLLAVLAATGAFAPLVANAADVGTSMYQRNPIITHVKAPHNNGAVGRTAHAQQMHAISKNS